MGGWIVDDSGAMVQSVEEMAGRFYGELIGKIPAWRAKIISAPEQLEELEHEVRDAFGRGADLVVVGLLAVVMSNEDSVSASEASVLTNHRSPFRKGRDAAVEWLDGLGRVFVLRPNCGQAERRG